MTLLPSPLPARLDGSRVVAEALQPGINEVYFKILGPSSPSFNTQPVPAALAGKLYKDVRRKFSKVAL